jgi:uncharacterized protein (TIGR02246 family)
MGARSFLASVAVVIGLACPAPLLVAQQPSREQDEQAIRQTAKDYLAAVARGDASALAEFWTADGDLVDEFGRTLPARELIASVAKAAGAAGRTEVELKDTKIRFLTADVAIEDGGSAVVSQGSPAASVSGRFLAVWVRQEGKWRLATLREERAEPVSIADRLETLDGLAGDWSGAAGDTVLEVAARWNAERTYLLREMVTLRDGKAVFSGSQRIGWDPQSGVIKSWVFDSNGGRGEGVWTRSGDGWIVHATHVLPDGEQAVSSSSYTPTGKDQLVWKSTVTLPGGRTMPEIVVQLQRKADSP